MTDIWYSKAKELAKITSEIYPISETDAFIHLIGFRSRLKEMAARLTDVENIKERIDLEPFEDSGEY